MVLPCWITTHDLFKYRNSPLELTIINDGGIGVGSVLFKGSTDCLPVIHRLTPINDKQKIPVIRMSKTFILSERLKYLDS